MQLLPVNNEPSQKFTTVLGEFELKIEMWYQDIGAGWFITMEFVDGDTILSGARLNSSAPLLASTPTELPGDIVPTPLNSPGVELGEEPWETTHTLTYLTDAELIEVGLAPI